jgi:nucleoside-diphosphate-sugar epimerase
MSDKIILLTGASGFIGRHVVTPLLERGYTIHAITHTKQPSKEVIWHNADLLNAKEHRQIIEKIHPHSLLHLAWYVEHGKFWNAPENVLWQDASIDLFSYAKTVGVKRLVSIGTCAEYDWNRKDTTPFKESDPCLPHTLYGKAKLSVFESLKSTYTNFAWGRIFHLFGKREHTDRLVSSVIHALKNDQPAKCTSGKQVQDFMDVQDVGAAIAALLDSEVTGPVNIASGKGTSVAEMALMIGRLMQKENLVQLNALPDRPDTPAYIVADIERLKREVRFTPSFSLEERLAQLIIPGSELVV